MVSNFTPLSTLDLKIQIEKQVRFSVSVPIAFSKLWKSQQQKIRQITIIKSKSESRSFARSRCCCSSWPLGISLQNQPQSSRTISLSLKVLSHSLNSGTRSPCHRFKCFHWENVRSNGFRIVVMYIKLPQNISIMQRRENRGKKREIKNSHVKTKCLGRCTFWFKVHCVVPN